MESTAKQVSRKIINKLVSVSVEKEFVSNFSKEEKEHYKFIKTVGGESVSNILELEKEQKKLNSNTARNELNKKVKELGLDPRWKIITYGSLMEILKEHNLVMGGLQNYIKEIPKENAKVMAEYAKRSRSDKYSGYYYPLFNVLKNDLTTDRKNLKFYICASIDNFKKENRYKVGQELIYTDGLNKPKFELLFPNPDPIVISPLVLNCGGENFLLLDVVTSWDREAGLIVNEINN